MKNMTMNEFAEIYGVSRPHVNLAVRAADLKCVGHIQVKRQPTQLFRETDIMKAVVKYFQFNRDNMLDRARGWQGKAEDVVGIYKGRMAKDEGHDNGLCG